MQTLVRRVPRGVARRQLPVGRDRVDTLAERSTEQRRILRGAEGCNVDLVAGCSEIEDAHCGGTL